MASLEQGLFHLLLPLLSRSHNVLARFLLEIGHHDIVVPYFDVFIATIREHIEVINTLKMVKSLVNKLRRYDRKVWLIQQ